MSALPAMQWLLYDVPGDGRLLHHHLEGAREDGLLTTWCARLGNLSEHLARVAIAG